MRKISKIMLIILSTLSLQSFAENERIISVTSSAAKSIPANMVKMRVEIWGNASSAKQAKSLNEKEFDKVKKIIEKFKIKSEDSQTTEFSVTPQYEYQSKNSFGGKNVLVGFKSLHFLELTLRKIDEAGDLIDALVSSGKNGESGINVNNIVWDSSFRLEAELEALNNAIMVSKKKAEQMAKSAGVKIKGPYKITHHSHEVLTVPAMQMMKSNYSPESVGGIELIEGQINVKVDVTAEYEMN